LIPGKIIKIVVTRCHILQLKCTKFEFGWGSTPNPHWGSLQRSPRPPAGFKGASYFKGDGKGWGWRGEEGMEWDGRGKEGSQSRPL